MDENEKVYALLSGGGVEYAIGDAAVDIDELIDALQDAKDNDVTHVVMSSGNYRGARWAKVHASWSWVDDED